MKSRISQREQRRRKQIRNARKTGGQSNTTEFIGRMFLIILSCFSVMKNPIRALIRIVFLNQKTLGTLFIFCLVTVSLIVFKAKVIDHGYENLPEKVEISVEEPALRDALEKNINGLLATGLKKKLNKNQFIEQLEAMFAEFPAVSVAKQKFLLNRTLQVRVQLHEPTFEIEDSDGRSFVFNEMLAPLGQSPIIGLKRPPIRMRISDRRLQVLADKSQKLVLRPALNYRHFFTRATALQKLQKSRPEYFGSSPIEYSDENGFSLCLRPEKLKCSRIILGPEPDLKNLEEFLIRVSSTKMSSLESADLRIPGKALVKEFVSANKAKEGVE